MMMSVMVLFLSRDLVSDTQAQGQGRQGDQQYGRGQDGSHLEIVAPTDSCAFLGQYMQPQQGSQTADRGELGAQVAANDIGVNHGFLDRALGAGSINRQGSHQHSE